MRSMIPLQACVAALLTLAPAAQVQGQTPATPTSEADRWMSDCRDNRWTDDERFCEVRNYTLPATKSLRVDGRDNGGVHVFAWDGNSIQVVAKVEARGDTQAEAQAAAKDIVVHAANGEVSAEGPRNRGRYGWAVSYSVFVPRSTDLSLTARNGGIAVQGVASRMDLETTNGGLTLADVNGDVRGTTVNGGLSVRLSGDRWQGAGLDVRTTNGGLRMEIPENYSAQLETSTVNGGMNVDFPVTVQGRIGRKLTTQLGQGGPPLRLSTINGGLSIRRR